MPMVRGDIHWVELEVGVGREQHGLRPAILLTGNTAGIVTIVPITSGISAIDLPCTELIRPTPSNGLDTPSTAMVFQMRAIFVDRLGLRMGSLTPEELRAIDGHIIAN